VQLDEGTEPRSIDYDADALTPILHAGNWEK